jgi:carbonic anhydrase
LTTLRASSNTQRRWWLQALARPPPSPVVHHNCTTSEGPERWTAVNTGHHRPGATHREHPIDVQHDIPAGRTRHQLPAVRSSPSWIICVWIW